MAENQDIHGAILAIVESLRLQGTSPGRLKNFKNAYNVFEHYLSDNSIARIDENISMPKVDTETGRKASEAAYVDILSTTELPDWYDDKNLMDFLISLGRQ